MFIFFLLVFGLRFGLLLLMFFLVCFFCLVFFWWLLFVFLWIYFLVYFWLGRRRSMILWLRSCVIIGRVILWYGVFMFRYICLLVLWRLFWFILCFFCICGDMWRFLCLIFFFCMRNGLMVIGVLCKLSLYSLIIWVRKKKSKE